MSARSARQDEMTRLVEPQIPALRRYARLLTRDAFLADDLVQDCLERTFTRWHLRKADHDVRPWLFSILHNIAMDGRRQSARRGVHVGLDDIGEAEQSRAASQEHGLLHADLLAAVGHLPEDQRAVLLLVAVEGLSYAEAATVLSIPAGTVMSRLSRARDHLHRIIDGDDADPSAPPNLRIVR